MRSTGYSGETFHSGRSDGQSDGDANPGADTDGDKAVETNAEADTDASAKDYWRCAAKPGQAACAANAQPFAGSVGS